MKRYINNINIIIKYEQNNLNDIINYCIQSDNTFLAYMNCKIIHEVLNKIYNMNDPDIICDLLDHDIIKSDKLEYIFIRAFVDKNYDFLEHILLLNYTDTIHLVKNMIYSDKYFMYTNEFSERLDTIEIEHS